MGFFYDPDHKRAETIQIYTHVMRKDLAGYVAHLIDYLEGKAIGINEKLVRKPKKFRA